VHARLAGFLKAGQHAIMRAEMADHDESPIPGADAVVSISNRLVAWFIETALPVWERSGIDRSDGGYFETLAADAGGEAVLPAGDVRRGRVVARQVYVFDVAMRLGWQPPAGIDPMSHGCDFLFGRLYGGQGIWHTAVDVRSGRIDEVFSLYEQAFYLFALARVQARWKGRYPAAAVARASLERLKLGFGRKLGGFEESNPPTEPLKSNPHMHLLEAALEWLDVCEDGDRQPWRELADDMVGLCLTRFCDPVGGAIREYFDFRWGAAPGEPGRIMEPGHQFEWGWLLQRWAADPAVSASVRLRCGETLRRLVDVGEAGVDHTRNVAVNELWDDLSVRDPAAKLWPQTERVKAWCAMLELAPSRSEAAHACDRIARAAHGLFRYLGAGRAGLWSEHCEPSGDFRQGPAKASSLYHIVCAIDVLRNTVLNRLMPSPAPAPGCALR
jgi:mannose-6-phosphate isomerase